MARKVCDPARATASGNVKIQDSSKRPEKRALQVATCFALGVKGFDRGRHTGAKVFCAPWPAQPNS